MGVIVAVTLAFGAAMATADAPAIDVEHSTLTVHVFKAGLFAAFAENHVIRAPIAEGHVSEVGVLAVDAIVHTAEMRVVDPTLPTDKRAEVQARMHGPEVLDSSRYPDIRFASTRMDPDGADQWRVPGDLTLHGVTRPGQTLVLDRSHEAFGVGIGVGCLKRSLHDANA